jgi:hypothetical protein
MDHFAIANREYPPPLASLLCHPLEKAERETYRVGARAQAGPVAKLIERLHFLEPQVELDADAPVRSSGYVCSTHQVEYILLIKTRNPGLGTLRVRTKARHVGGPSARQARYRAGCEALSKRRRPCVGWCVPTKACAAGMRYRGCAGLVLIAVAAADRGLRIAATVNVSRTK